MSHSQCWASCCVALLTSGTSQAHVASRPCCEPAGPWGGELLASFSTAASEQLAREASAAPAAVEFYEVAVPAVPLLLLGFVCLEGRELVSCRHRTGLPAGLWACLTDQAGGLPCCAVVTSSAASDQPRACSVQRLTGMLTLCRLARRSNMSCRFQQCP